MAKNIYALFVAIDDYPAPVPKLQGCKNDAQIIIDHLHARTAASGSKFYLETLFDEEATRQNILDKMQTHLTQAQEGDVALFYYVGHGSQEPTPEIFWDMEEDKMNETIVCYDSRVEDGMDLADKEMATMFEQISCANPHFLIIYDCCHSGSGDRSSEVDVLSRQAPDYSKKRPLDSYVLPKPKDSNRAIEVDPSKILVPQSRHVFISAAESFQTAKETSFNGERHGVFTFNLAKILSESKGALTYNDLLGRLRTFVGNKASDQTPTISVSNPDDLNLLFLDGAVGSKEPYFTLSWLSSDTKDLRTDESSVWIVDGGAVHGLVAGAKLLVFSGDAALDTIKNTASALGTITVERSSSSISVVTGLPTLNNTLTYKAVLSQLPVAKQKIAIIGDSAGVAAASTALKVANLGLPSLYVELTPTPAAADYVIYCQENQYIFTRQADGVGKPLIEQLDGYTAENATKIIDQAEHIAKWDNIVELSNPATQIDASAVKLQMYQVMPDGKEVLLGAGGKEIILDTKPNAPAKVRIKLVNLSAERYYCAPIYLGSRFEVFTSLFKEGGVWLEPGAEVYALDGNTIKASVDSSIVASGKTQSKEIWKLIISTSGFDAHLLKQNRLNMPKPPRLRSADALSPLSKVLLNVQERGFDFDLGDEGAGSSNDWTTAATTVTLRLV